MADQTNPKQPKDAKEKIVKKSKHELQLEQQVVELTNDLQRNQADFQNYRNRVEQEKKTARLSGQTAAITRLLPVIDNIERAIAYTPPELKDNSWVQSVAGLAKHLEKSLESLELKRIDASKGVEFNPDLHEAIQFDEDAEGEKEVIEEELQAGYLLAGTPLRHAMVKVTRQ